jgi:hypothetical protein
MEFVLKALFSAYLIYATYALVRNTRSLVVVRRMGLRPGTFAWLAVLYPAGALAELCLASVFVLYFFHADQEPLPFFLAVGAMVFGVAAFIAMKRLRRQHFAPTRRIW